MPGHSATSRIISQHPIRITHGRQLGRHMPRTFTRKSWWLFLSRRRTALVGTVGGQPDERQGRLIETLIRVEWAALESEETARTLKGKAKIDALRLAAEYRRQMLLLDRDLARTLPKPAPQSASPKEPPALPDLIAAAVQGRK